MSRRFLTPYDRLLLRYKPLGYWKLGGWRNAGGETEVPDLSGRGQDVTGAASGTGNQNNRRNSILRGDPHAFSMDTQGLAWRRTGGVSGFSASEGTILVWAIIREALTGGLVDTAPSAVGALRIFSEDNWATLRWDIGGSELTSNFSKSLSAIAPDTKFFGVPHLFAIAWRTGFGDVSGPNMTFDGESLTPDGGYALRDKTPANPNFDIGSYNNSRGPFTIQSAAMFNRYLQVAELAELYRAGMDQRLLLAG